MNQPENKSKNLEKKPLLEKWCNFPSHVPSYAEWPLRKEEVIMLKARKNRDKALSLGYIICGLMKYKMKIKKI